MNDGKVLCPSKLLIHTCQSVCVCIRTISENAVAEVLKLDLLLWSHKDLLKVCHIECEGPIFCFGFGFGINISFCSFHTNVCMVKIHMWLLAN